MIQSKSCSSLFFWYTSLTKLIKEFLRRNQLSAAEILFFSGYFLNTLTILFILFFEHGDSGRRFSWLLAVFAIPWIGLVLYILLSGTFFTRTKRMTRAIDTANSYYNRILYEQEKSLTDLLQSGTNKVWQDYGSLVHMNLVYGKSPLLAGNTVQLFTNGKEKYKALFTEIEEAKSTVHLSYFIFQNDYTGNLLLEILQRKAKEGLSIRLLYDHVGSIRTASSFFNPLKKAGGQVHRFFPVSFLNPFSVNYRNHRKIVVIDGKSAWFGGMNIGDEYANQDPKRGYYWRDTHVRITGPAVQLLQKQFLVDWYSASKESANVFEAGFNSSFFPQLSTTSKENEATAPENTSLYRTQVPAQIISSGPDDKKNDEIRDALILMISRAKKSVFIQTPYFTPDTAFFTSLKIAALSGLDVRIILPGNWDKWYVRLAAMPYIEELLEYGVKFYRYNGFIHSKMFIVDTHIVSIGSTNVDNRSFSLHFELNAFFYSVNFGQLCTDIFAEDESNSFRITKADFEQVPLRRRALWNFFKLFAPMM
jgi:cardiolipin synthase A/B